MNPDRVRIDGSSAPAAPPTQRLGPLDLVITTAEEGSGLRHQVVLRNPGPTPVAVDEVALHFAVQPARVLEHGWQSWSVVRRCPPDDVRPDRADVPAWTAGVHQADPGRAGRVVAGDQFLLWDGGVAGFLAGDRHLSVVECGPSGIWAVALLDGIEIGPKKEWPLDPLWVATGDPGVLYSEYATRWGEHSGARRAAAAPLGWCSWYQYFANVTPDDVRANITHAVEHGIELVQIDDGYQAAIGDWLATNDRWSDGLVPSAGHIGDAGLQAGIWTAPFLAGENSELARAHPNWLASYQGRKPLRAMYNPGSWGGWAFALDTTQPEVLDHLRATFAALRAMGFDYHKIDFCYSAGLSGERQDRTMTRAQALRAGLAAVREGIGDDAFLLGCGCPLAQAVGIVDAMRVSPDVAPHWHPRFTWPGYEESAVAAVNAIRASVLRAPLHRRLFVNDPDCLLIRRTDSDLTADQILVLAATVAGTGGFVLLSDDLSTYTDAQWSLLERVRGWARAGDSPIDIADPFAKVPTLAGRSCRLAVDWREGSTQADLPALRGGGLMVDPPRPGPRARLVL